MSLVKCTAAITGIIAMVDSLEAFRNFDFDSNPAWTYYKDHLEIPAGKSVDWSKFKGKWYKREVDPEFDLSSIQAEAASSVPTPPPQTSTTGPEGNASRPTGVPHNGVKTAPPQKCAKGFLGKILNVVASNSEERLFFLHLGLVVFAVLHLQPVARVLAARSWAYFLQTAILTHAYKVYLGYGTPQVWPFSLQKIQTWLVPVTASTDFQYALISTVFLTAKPIILIMFPIVTLSVYHIFAYLSKNFGRTSLWLKYGAGANEWLATRQQPVLLYNAAAEIGGGFLVIASLLAPPRSFILVFIYFQFLRMRFWSPDASTYHRMVWSQIDEKVGRYLDMVPALRIPIGYIQRWFLNAPQSGR